MRITADQLKSLVKSDVLNVRSEEKVYEALLKWVKHDVDGRHQYIPDLMQVHVQKYFIFILLTVVNDELA